MPRGLEQVGWLERFYTDLCADVGPLRLAKMIPTAVQPGGLRRLLARRVDGVPRQRIRAFSTFGIRRLLRRPGATAPAMWRLAQQRANEQFGRLVCRAGFGAADTVYVFNAAGLEILQAARKLGLRGIVDQTCAPIAFEEALVAEEQDRWPGWEFEGTNCCDWQAMADRETAEWALAQRVICGSQHVVDGIEALGGPVERCRIVPYGVDTSRFRPIERPGHDGALRVLFVGTLELRKGIPYLLAAARQLKDQGVTIRAVGPNRLAAGPLTEVSREIDVVGMVPRSAILEHYAWADVFVMPSISEGSSNATYEALATGLPVVTTPNSGSIVRDGIEGHLVPIRSAEQLAAKLAALAADRQRVRELGEAAVARARQFTWQAYARRLAEAIAPGNAEVVDVRASDATESSPTLVAASGPNDRGGAHV